jgi:branched-chain amino acid transport system substrate-binding protein
LTGEVASYGEDCSRGINTALDIANQASSKYRFEVLFEDSKGNGADASAAANKLIGVNKVLAIIGDTISGPTMAMVPFADAGKVTLLSPSASTPKLSGISRYFFRIYPSDTAEGSFMAQTAHQFGLKRVGIMYINNDFGVGLRNVFSSTFGSLGGRITEAIGYNDDETNFRPYLARIKGSAPDGIYLAGYYNDGGSILRQARELGIAARFLGSTTHEDPRLITAAKDAANGFVYPMSTGYDKDSTAAPVTGFQKAYRAKYGKAPGFVAALGYDCFNLLAAAVEARGPDRDAIRSFLAGTKGYQGVSGEITFEANGDVHKPVFLKTVRDGKFVRWEPGPGPGGR